MLPSTPEVTGFIQGLTNPPNTQRMAAPLTKVDLDSTKGPLKMLVYVGMLWQGNGIQMNMVYDCVWVVSVKPGNARDI